MSEPFIHPTAEVSPEAQIGEDTHIWNLSKIREGARIGSECNIGQNVYIDVDVSIGDRVKIQNNASLYRGVTIEDGVFIGPHVCFCNDLIPRAITLDGRLQNNDDWQVSPTTVRYGASIGAGSILIPGITIGRFAMIGAGSVVSRSVPDHALVYGNPARQHGFVCKCGRKLTDLSETPDCVQDTCAFCHETYTLIRECE